jgi:hypothetical protein
MIFGEFILLFPFILFNILRTVGKLCYFSTLVFLFPVTYVPFEIPLLTKKQEVLLRTNRLFSFDTTRTA